MEIFLDGTRHLKFCYTNISPLQRIFSIEILLFGRWLMVVPSIDYSNSVPDTHIGGFLKHVKAVQQPLRVYLCTHDSHPRS